MLNPRIITALKKHRRQSASFLPLLIFAYLCAVLIASYFTDTEAWEVVIILAILFILATWAVTREGFEWVVLNKPDEIESITNGSFGERPMLTLRTKAGKSYSLLLNKTEEQEILPGLKSGLPSQVKFF